MKKRIKMVSATLALALALTGVVAVSTPPEPAEASTTYWIYESRSTVETKAKWLGWGTWGCGFLPWNLGSAVCNTGSAGLAYEFAAANNCKLATKVVINNSSFSWGRTSNKYYPYACLG